MAFLDRHLGKLVWLAGAAALALVLREIQTELPSSWGVHPWAYLGVTGVILILLHAACGESDPLWSFDDSSAPSDASDSGD